MRRTNRQSGFTLLELLIAIAIMSLILTTAFAAVRIGDRSWVAGQARSDSIEEMRSFAEFLRRRMGETVTASWRVENKTRIAFTGQRQLIRFVAPAPAHSGGPGLLTYSLRVSGTHGQSRLQLDFKPFDPGATAFHESARQRRISFTATFESAAFDFYGAPDADSASIWHRDWPQTAELYPKLVRIRFATQDDTPAWPDLVVPLRSRQAL